MSQPLKGLLVVAIEQAVAAPFCTARLADAGARVIKIERNDGDFARDYDDIVDGESAYFVWLNRGKESICLDIKNDDDRSLLLSIIDTADVFIQNLAPGAAERAGLGVDVLRARNDQLITVDITGYGPSGEYSKMKAYDLLVQCETGLASITGSPAEPGRVGISIGDIACGMSAHAAILEALIERGLSNNGKALHVSLFDSLADWMTVPLLYQEHTGNAPARVGIAHASIAPYGAYACGDGENIVIAIQNNREWRRFCEQVIDRPELAIDERYIDNSSRCDNRASMNEQITSGFEKMTREQVRDRLLSASIAFGSINDLQSLSAHPQLRRVKVDTASGEAMLVCPPAAPQDFSPGPVPALGEHSDAIRREFSNEQ